MIVVTNPGSNLPQELARRYNIEVCPQQIVVDGEAHDTRAGIPFDRIDEWIRTATTHPHVLGTTAGEFVSAFSRAARRDRELLAVMTSRKIIGSHDAAVVAARSMMERRQELSVDVSDTGVTDLGAGLACLLAAKANEAGLSRSRIVELLESYRAAVRLYIVPRTLEYLVKGGRATSVRAFFADLFGVRPILSFVRGELSAVGKVAVKADLPVTIAAHAANAIGSGRPVWCAVFHGGAPLAASFAADELRRRFDVKYVLVRPISPGIYVHTGPETLGVVVVPLDELTWMPEEAPSA